MCVVFVLDDEYDDDAPGAGVCCRLSVEQSVPLRRMIGVCPMSVSYTHLDVYKRQPRKLPECHPLFTGKR